MLTVLKSKVKYSLTEEFTPIMFFKHFILNSYFKSRSSFCNIRISLFFRMSWGEEDRIPDQRIGRVVHRHGPCSN